MEDIIKTKKSDIRNQAIKGIFWKVSEKIGVQAFQFIIQIVLARLLMPEEYGLVGLLSIFISISDVLVQQGFTSALIQKKDINNIDYNSVFWINVLVSIFLYFSLYIISPYIALFYNHDSLTMISRVLSINIIIGAFGAVQNAILTKSLDFKKSFIRNIISVIFSGIVGIYLAICGFGVWALVISKLVLTLTGTIVLFLTVKWKIKFEISLANVSKLFSFSSKILLTNLMNVIFNNIHSLIIGKYYSSAELGYYQRGQQMPQVAMSAIDSSLNEVLYPTLSIMQDDNESLKNILRRSMKISVFLVFPLLFVGFLISAPLTEVLLTEKWLPCVPYFKLQCIICMFYPFSARTHAINALGKSNITLKVSLITKSMTLLFIFVFIKQGITAIMLGTIFAQLISFFITSYYIKKEIGYTYTELYNDVMPILLCSIFCSFVSYIFTYCFANNILLIISQCVCFITSYLVCMFLIHNDSLEYLLNYIKK